MWYSSGGDVNLLLSPAIVALVSSHYGSMSWSGDFSWSLILTLTLYLTLTSTYL